MVHQTGVEQPFRLFQNGKVACRCEDLDHHGGCSATAFSRWNGRRGNIRMGIATAGAVSLGRDSSDPRYNPLLQPVAPRTPSNHCTSARKLRVSDSLLYYLSEKGYRHFINVSVRKTT
ncbi:hypothetical protein F511_44148 [Dorcoceras hygrometricum]|uniref:Uncharacterized protein n=1 Tax=Dorcoceras hygrometricum TaxID=472368 RepID=A0A2Z6ZY63_9LAMI|nr:hypothetical protein F511_44148 [Dorcoceras hygrometricum]